MRTPELRFRGVGVAGFEPTASSSRTKRATKLRHTPVEPSQHSGATRALRNAFGTGMARHAGPDA